MEQVLAVPVSRNTLLVIPAKAGIHFAFAATNEDQDGFQLSLE
jgi:hypothetical protein